MTKKEITHETFQALNDLRDEAYQTAVSKGWYEKPRSVGDAISLMHSELSEALEDYRSKGHVESWKEENGKPAGVPSELADVLIRVFDFCGSHNIDIAQAVKEKMAFNQTRPHRHGGKVL